MNSSKMPLCLLLATSILTTAGCGFRSTATDPGALEAQFKASKVEERELLTDVVQDPEQVKALILLLEERDRTVIAYADVVENYISKMRLLNADYDATRSDFDRLITDYRTARQNYQKDLIAVIQRMKAATTEKEWKRLAKFQLNELNPREMTPSTGGA